MATLYTLSGIIKDVDGDPISSALVTVTPVPPFTLDDGTIVTGASMSPTDADGVWSIWLYPTPINKPNYVYLVTVKKSNELLLSKTVSYTHLTLPTKA